MRNSDAWLDAASANECFKALGCDEIGADLGRLPPGDFTGFVAGGGEVP
jgi:hypothetical protein